MRSICTQLFAVYALVGLCAYAAELANFNSLLNLSWMVGLPIGTAVAANWNKGVVQAIAMAIALLACAFGGLATAINYTGA